MERKDKDPQQSTHGGNHGTGGNEDQFGNKSFAGATSADYNKQRLQTVEANDLDDTDLREGNTGNGQPAGSKNKDTDRDPQNAEDDIIDQGSVRTAAFDEGNEPRSEESLKNRGTTLGSDDRPSKG